jgi:hypothetical protein
MVNRTIRSLASALAAIGIASSFSGCSTVETNGGPSGPVSSHERIQLRVQTDNAELDARVYELAYAQFSAAMPLRREPPYTATLEITFASTGQSSFAGGTGTAPHSHGDWYTGDRVARPPSSRGDLLTWQNSTMFAVLKHVNGDQIWNTTYRYNGGYELSGLTIHTPDQAAGLIVKRLAARYVQDARVPQVKK